MLHIITILDTVATAVATAWAGAAEIITIGAMLWGLNALANLIRGTYAAGKAFGQFYWAHLHKWVVRYIAFKITVCIYAWEGAQHLYNERRFYLAQLNDFRNAVGRQFIYA